MVFTIRGLVRLQLISENYSRRLSIFRLFAQPGSKTEAPAGTACPFYPQEQTSSGQSDMSVSCHDATLRRERCHSDPHAHPYYGGIVVRIGTGASSPRKICSPSGSQGRG